MILKIAQLGQPVLRQVAAPVDPDQIGSGDFQSLLDDMLETLEHVKGAGLAAPQVFSSRRVFLAGILPPTGNERIPGYECLINPRIIEASAEKELAWEGCLSFIELLVHVPRHIRLTVEYLDRHGKIKRLSLSGFPARVIQHEYDHLDGVLTIDRAPSTKDIIKASEIDAIEGHPEPDIE